MNNFSQIQQHHWRGAAVVIPSLLPFCLFPCDSYLSFLFLDSMYSVFNYLKPYSSPYFKLENINYLKEDNYSKFPFSPDSFALMEVG